MEQTQSLMHVTAPHPVTVQLDVINLFYSPKHHLGGNYVF